MSGRRKWYVVHTHAHSEAIAAAHLERQGFEIYYPRYMKRRSHARRVTVVAAPFFPRYIFVAIDVAAQRWHTVRSTLGVSSLVGGEAGPTPVADAVVAELRASEDKQGLIARASQSRLQRGDRVRLCDSIFSAYAGLFDGMADNNRVAVLLDLLGRKVRVTLDRSAVSAA